MGETLGSGRETQAKKSIDASTIITFLFIFGLRAHIHIYIYVCVRAETQPPKRTLHTYGDVSNVVSY